MMMSTTTLLLLGWLNQVLSMQYGEASFNNQLHDVTSTIRQVLHDSKFPAYAEDVPHSYDDKYTLAEVLTHTALLSNMHVLTQLGAHKGDAWAKSLIDKAAEGDTIWLSYASEERCVFNRTETSMVETGHAQVEEVQGLLGTTSKTTKVKINITKHYWDFSIGHTLTLHSRRGAEPEEQEGLYRVLKRVEKVTSVESPPYVEINTFPPVLLDITWWLKHLSYEMTASGGIEYSPVFTIARNKSSCHTPRRNAEVHEADRNMDAARIWARTIWTHFRAHDVHSLGIRETHFLALSSASQEVFHPVAPLMYSRAPETETVAEEATTGNENNFLGAADLRTLLREEASSLESHTARIQRLFQPQDPQDALKVADSSSMHRLNAEEVRVFMAVQHWGAVGKAYSRGVTYIEEMLLNQLVAAVGKHVSAADLLEFMNSHHMDGSLFRPEFATRPFAYAVRRSGDSSPEGFVSVEQKVPGGEAEAPIRTMTHRHGGAPELMSMRLSAGTSIRFGGERYVHGWLHHQFASEGSGQMAMVDSKVTRDIGLSLMASARQFSSFILVVGRVASNTEFVPQHAVMVRDKDTVRIPLFLETVPNAQEFQDFISSLSPAQRAFAEAYREMQLQHSLLGVLVVQIKPQLEKVLGLPEGALTKEIQLTRDLMDLLVDYQIPSDLLSHSTAPAIATPLTDNGADADNDQPETQGPAHTPAAVEEGVSAVKKHVAAMKTMIAAAKEEEVENRRREAAYNNPLPTATPSSIPAGAPSSLPSRGGGAESGMQQSGPKILKNSRHSVTSFAAEESFGAATKPVMLDASALADGACGSSGSVHVTVGSGDSGSGGEFIFSGRSATVVDISSLPQVLDRKLNNHNRYQHGANSGADTAVPDHRSNSTSVQANILHVAPVWTRKRQASLVGGPGAAREENLLVREQKAEWTRVMDLLDMITKSGALDLDGTGQVAMHVVVSSTCRFEDSLINSIIRGNINPINELDSTLAVIAATIHNTTIAEVTRD